MDHTPGKRSLIPKEAIQLLLEIRGLPESDFWKVAEGEWEKIEQKFTGRVAKSRKQISNVSNEIYQVVGFSAAFQGLLLTAASQGSFLTCNTKWGPLVLSVFATLAAGAAVWEKNRIITFLQGSVKADEHTRKVQTNVQLCSLQLENSVKMFHSLLKIIPPIAPIVSDNHGCE